MQRPANYNTKHGMAIIAYLETVKDRFVTAAQITAHLQKTQASVSRPTIYRQLEKLVHAGKVRRVVFQDTSGACFQYVDAKEYERGSYHLKCEICDGIFDLQCDTVVHVSRHILESHAFQVNDSKTVFYGKCGMCLQK